jgi:phosphoesterase RecJ-like protein
MSLERVITTLRKNKSFLLTTHLNMEADALGAELALYYLLRKLGKEVTIVNEQRVLAQYNFLPGIKLINTFNSQFKKMRWDCFIILDCADLSRCGRVASLKSLAKTSLNIDHHVSNHLFCEINWVGREMSSAAEMVYLIYKRLKVRITKDIATLLFAGIATDTGFFHYSNTSSFTHQVAARLLECGVNCTDIYRHLYEDVPFKDAQILARGYRQVKCLCRGKIVWLSLSRDLVKEGSPGFDLGEHFLSFMRAIKGVEVALLFKENLKADKKEIKVNLRSQGKVDVNKIAQFLGGGGHQTASGATISGSLKGVIRKVLAKIKEQI